MRSLSFVIAALFALVALSACSSDAEPAPSWSITIADAPEKLTSNPSDRLFRIQLTSGPALVPSELGAVVTFPSGSSGTFRQVVLEDANANQKLDDGESILVLEGSSNVFSEAFATQTAQVSLVRFAKDDPPSGQALASGTWKAD